MACTNNTNRGVGTNPGTDAANPRPANRAGHIIEMTEMDGDHASMKFAWEILVLCGIPGDSRYEPTYFGGFDKGMVSSIGAPDNVAFDSRGNLWIATDGQPSAIGWNDGIFAMPVDGEDRGYLRQLMSCPNGAEVCGPEFTRTTRRYSARFNIRAKVGCWVEERFRRGRMGLASRRSQRCWR